MFSFRRKPVDNLRAIKKLLNRNTWSKNNLARDITGKRVDPSSPDANSWCLLGALYKVKGEKGVLSDIELDLLNKAVRLYTNDRYLSILAFNDSIKTELKDIYGIIDVAIVLAKRKA